jgi:hypothetical protein
VEYHANPNLNRGPVANRQGDPHHSNNDNAIMAPNAEIVRILLQHGAFVGHVLDTHNGTALNVLLFYHEKSLETKLSIYLSRFTRTLPG